MDYEQIDRIFAAGARHHAGNSYDVTLEDVREGWKEYEASQRGDAVYGYLHMVFELVNWWLKSPVKRQKALRRIQKENPDLRLPADLYATVILVTADPQITAKRRSVWARALRYVAEFKPTDEFVRDFMKRKKGVNACAARYTRWVRRKAECDKRRRQASRRAKQKRDLRS